MYVAGYNKDSHLPKRFRFIHCFQAVNLAIQLAVRVYEYKSESFT